MSQCILPSFQNFFLMSKCSCRLSSTSPGIAYWKSGHGIQVFAMLSICTTAGWYFLTPTVTLFILPRCRHIFLLEQLDGVFQPWQLILHSVLHFTAIIIAPTIIAMTVALFMVLDVEVSFTDVAWGSLFSLLAQVFVVACTLLAVCAAPGSAYRLTSLMAMFTFLFQGFIVPRPGLPVVVRWLTYVNPTFWIYSSIVQTILKGKHLPCHNPSPLSCPEKNLNERISEFGLDVINPYAAIFYSMVWIALVLFLAVVSLSSWKQHLEILKHKVSHHDGNTPEGTG